MYLGEPNLKRRKNIIRAILGSLVLLFILSFWKEIGDVLAIFWHILKAFANRTLPSVTPQEGWSAAIMGYTCFFGFFFVFFLWLGMISAQALLPVTSPKEMLRAGWHLLLYILRIHGPAVFVKDGKLLSTAEDIREGAGVAVVDFNSAIVLEERVSQPGIQRLVEMWLHQLKVFLGLEDRTETPRACGAGVVFMRPRERIRGVVDLRRQFRSDAKVPAYTRDGIEVSSRVWAQFTIGQEPDVVQVTYDGEHRPEKLRVVTLEKLPEGYYRVASLTDELDSADRDEIHHMVRVAMRQEAFQAYCDLREPDPLPVFNRDRVFSAVFSEARSEQLLSWTELPTRVAASSFREIMMQVNYDQFYNIGGEDKDFPLPRYKSRLRQSLRNNGLLSYRLLFHKDGLNIKDPVQLRVKKAYHETELMVTAVRPLTSPKILRDRGIKVIAAGFGDINPVSDAVYRQRLEAWRAPWQRDTEVLNAAWTLQASRVRSHARALAQQELVTNLNGIFKQNEFSQEALAIRLLQAVENVAADPKTRQLLPLNTLDMMKIAHDWLLPGDNPAAGPVVLPSDGEDE